MPEPRTVAEKISYVTCSGSGYHWVAAPYAAVRDFVKAAGAEDFIEFPVIHSVGEDHIVGLVAIRADTIVRYGYAHFRDADEAMDSAKAVSRARREHPEWFAEIAA